MVSRMTNLRKEESSRKTQNQFTFKADFPRGRGCRRKSVSVQNEPPTPAAIPRIAKLLALAHHLEEQVRSGAAKDYAELSTLLGVSRARITQILNLLLLAPDIQETILFLPPTPKGHAPTDEHNLRAIAAEPDWAKQREKWKKQTNLAMKARVAANSNSRPSQCLECGNPPVRSLTLLSKEKT